METAPTCIGIIIEPSSTRWQGHVCLSLLPIGTATDDYPNEVGRKRSDDMVTVYIENQPYEVADGQNLLHAALSLGMNLPYFCWHPAMGSVGACRLCAVKQFRDENDTRGRLVMSCMTMAAPNTRISLADPEAHEFRRSVIEWLMINHPHDCPVCDEGGHCHLQDMTYMTGHAYRRYRFEKRTYRNQYLGPLLRHEMNRCIQCYRCVRFYRDYAGGADLQAFAIHDHVYFGRHADGVLENEFSGNLVEVCPTGVFTDKTLSHHYTRKWDLQSAPSVCVNCSVGCNIIPSERYGTLRRVFSRYNDAVNRYFLCDRGRYGYEFVNSTHRIRQPYLRRHGCERAEPATRAAALEHLSTILGQHTGGKAVIGIGSPRASLESNFALRTLVGAENFATGMGEREHNLVTQMLDILQRGPARSPSLHEMEQADAIFVLGEDLTNTAPMMALALRQASRRQPMAMIQAMKLPEWQDASVREVMQDARSPFFLATPAATKLDDVATHTYRAAPDDIARLGFAVANALDGAAPAVSGLSAELTTLVATIADALRAAKRPLIVAGASLGSAALVQAAANVAWALCDAARVAELAFAPPECNSFGVGLMGGQSLETAVAALRNGHADTVVILENDLYRRGNAGLANALFAAAAHVIAIDHLTNPTAARAEVVLSTATFAEGDGTLVNHEGRAQRFYQVMTPNAEIQESWRWLRDLMAHRQPTAGAAWQNLDDVMAAMAQALPIFAAVPSVAPPAGFRIHQQKIARQSHRYSGRTAMMADVTMHEPKPPQDPDTPLTFSMEGLYGPAATELPADFWAPGWDSNQAVNKFQIEINGPLHGGDPGRRLLEPTLMATKPYFDAVPPVITAPAGQWLALPLYHIFGSEELSVFAPGIAELTPSAYVALHPAAAAQVGVAENGVVVVELAEASYRLPVKPMPSLPQGAVGVPVGLPDLESFALPQWVKLRPPQAVESATVLEPAPREKPTTLVPAELYLTTRTMHAIDLVLPAKGATESERPHERDR